MAGINGPPLFLKTIASCHRILEEGDLWDVECQKGENNTNHANYDERYSGRQATAVFSLEQLIFHSQCNTSRKEKDGDIQPIYRYAKDTGIGIIKHGNKRQPKQNPCQLNTPELFVILSPKLKFDQRKQKHRIIDQLHVLPNGFVYCGKDCSNNILTA